MYKDFLSYIYKLACNIVYVSYDYISHNIMMFEIVSSSYNSLCYLYISEDINISFDFSCDIDVFDRNHVFIDKIEIISDKNIYLYRSCHIQLSINHLFTKSLANFR